MSEKDRPVCGAPHPTIPGLLCEREVCVAYHLANGKVWTEGAAKLPSQTRDPQRMAGLLRRTGERRRRMNEKARPDSSS